MDAILVLGVELDAKDRPTDELAARIGAGLDAMERWPAAPVVLCGGVLPGHARAEADVMRGMMLARGADPARLLCERQSQNTMENLRFAKALLGGSKRPHVLVVTSDYHRLRAVLTAGRNGMRARGFAVRLPRDAAWRTLRLKEWAYTLDLLMGWQDEGHSRPAFTQRAFDIVFSGRGRRDSGRRA